MKRFFFSFFFLFTTGTMFAQTDTIPLNYQTVNTKALKPGVHTYLVYFRNGEDSSRVKSQVWTRRIDFVDFENTRAIRIEQKWEDADTVFHTVTSYCDRQSFAPLYQDAWWKSYGHFIFNFLNGETSVLGSPLKQEDTALYRKNILSAFEQAIHQEVFNWHLDLEVFSLIPYKANATYAVNFYDPGQASPQVQYYKIVGSNTLYGFDNHATDCWLLQHGSATHKEVFWISKETGEVLKLEQESNGKYRYKILLPFAP